MNINITMARQGLMLGGTVTAYLNGAEAAWIGNGQSIALGAAAGENELTFKSGLRSRTIKFKSTADVNVMLKWNRVTGSLEALCTGPDVEVLQ
ncbi:hypothetical protein SDC9_160714 [bioreactor metagenome]|uniref:Uncharacterized protein n=1 Tax=bioreactor metagenome TaxID=1076179 RepID=A0A645FMG7_9ZZZZ